MDKKNSSTWFWVGVAGSVAVLASAGYYLMNFLFSEEEVPEERKEKIEEIKNEIEELPNGEITEELAIKLMAEANKLAEDIFKKKYPDIDDRRRNALNDADEYQNICQEMFALKEEIYANSINIMLSKFDNKLKMDDIQAVLTKMNPSKLEQIAYKFEKPIFDRPYPDESTVKEAFLYYGTVFQNEMRIVQGFFSTHPNLDSDPERGMVILKLLVLKSRIDDLLYLKYKLTEQQVRYLLNEKNMLNDPEIQMVYSQITRFEEMFAGQ